MCPSLPRWEMASLGDLKASTSVSKSGALPDTQRLPDWTYTCRSKHVTNKDISLVGGTAPVRVVIGGLAERKESESSWEHLEVWC